MLSSPSNDDDHDSDQNPFHEDGDEDEDQDLFPSSDQPSTPKNNHLNATAPGELSPPQSQSTSQRIADNTADDPADLGGMADDGAADYKNNTNGIDGAGDMNGPGNEKYTPGMGWKTKKAQEEYQRAAETLTDRDFSLREFGDLFDDRAVAPQQTNTSQTNASSEQQQ